jgi:hypothetical protein
MSVTGTTKDKAEETETTAEVWKIRLRLTTSEYRLNRFGSFLYHNDPHMTDCPGGTHWAVH